MAELKRTMFREYDVRGRETDDELNEKSVYHIARGFGKMLRYKNITEAVVGHDARVTSEAFQKSAVAALTESGINVIDIGISTTPMSYFAQHYFDIQGLCMITASHNPTGWNGMKLGTGLSKTLLPAEIRELYSIVEREEYASGNGTKRTEEISRAYYTALLSRVTLKKKLKVLINCGNGTAGLFAPELFRKAGCEAMEHLTNVDPTYPNYTANPDGTAMMEDTGHQTVFNECNVGLAFDGDGDRLGVVDEKGATIWPDRYLILLSRLVLAKNPGAKIIFDVKVSEALPEDIRAHGGVPIMCKTGHSYIKAKMAGEKALLAGEMSGHVFFSSPFYFGFDDAFFAALKLLEYVAGQEKPLSELVADTPQYISTPTIQVETTDEAKYDIIEKLTSEFKSEGYKVIDLSGARVYMKSGWGLVRASSNTPTLVLRFEAKTKEDLEKIEEIFRTKLSKFTEVGSDWNTTGN